MSHRSDGSAWHDLVRGLSYGCLKLTFKHGSIFSLRAARLGAPGRRRRDRIFGPRMLRVAAAHLGAYGGVAAAPETGQVARRLHRPMRGGEKLDHQRHAAAGDGRMPVEPEQLLDADGDLWSALGLVIDRH